MEEVWEVTSYVSLAWLTIITVLVQLAMVSDHIISIKFTTKQYAGFPLHKIFSWLQAMFLNNYIIKISEDKPYLPTGKIFLQKLTPSNTRQIKSVNFKKRLAQFRRKIYKNQCFSGYGDTLMRYINFPVHSHIQEFIKETVFCNYYQFCTDAVMVSKKLEEEVKTNNFQ